MAFDSYTVEPNGAHVFVDSGTGASVSLAPTPSVLAHARKIDDSKLYAEAGEQAADVPPVAAVSATSAGEMERGAQEAPNRALASLGAPAAGGAPGPAHAVSSDPIGAAFKAETQKREMDALRGVAAGGDMKPVGQLSRAELEKLRAPPVEERPAAPPAPAAGGPPPKLITHKPGAAAAEEPGAGEPRVTPTGLRALTARERYEASLRRGFGGSKATPEFEQNQHYTDTMTRGPADERVQKIEEVETGPAPFEPGKYEAPRLDPKTLAGLVGLPTGEDAAAFDASLPPSVNAEQAQRLWYEKLAGEIADGASIASLRARYGGGLPQGTPPKDPKKMAEWAKGMEAAEARQGRVADLLDSKIAEHRKGFEAGEAKRAQGHAAAVETFGPEGEAGERAHVARQEARRMEYEAEQAGIGGEHNRQALEREAEIQAQLADDLRNTNAEIARVNREIESGEIDPKRWWNQKSTGEKVAAGIGILLAGIGGETALQHHMGRIDKEIDRDIEAQKDSLNKKRGKATALQDVYKNLIAAGASDMAATEAMRKAAWTGVEQNIRQNAALSGSDIKMREADRALGLAKKLQAERQAALSAGRRGGRSMAGVVVPARAASAGGRNLKLEAQEAEKTAKLEQELGKGGAETRKLEAEAQAPGGKMPQRFVVDGQTYHARNVGGEAEGAELRKKFAAIDTLGGILTKIEKLGPIDKLTPTGKRQVENLVGQYVSQEQKMLGEGVTRESDVDRAMRVQSSIFTGADVYKDLRAIHADIKEHNMQQAGAKPVR